MMSPLKRLKRRSWVIYPRNGRPLLPVRYSLAPSLTLPRKRRKVRAGTACVSAVAECAKSVIPRSGRPFEMAAGLGHRQCGVDALYQLVDLEQIFRFRALLDCVADIERRHQLVIAGAIERVIWHQGDFRRQFEVFECLCELYWVQRLLFIGDERAGPGRDITEPMTRCRHLAAVDLSDIGDEFLQVRNVGLHPIPFENPRPNARLGRQTFEHFEFLLRAGDMKALVETELHSLFERADLVLTSEQKNDDIRIGCLRLDQV